MNFWASFQGPLLGLLSGSNVKPFSPEHSFFTATHTSLSPPSQCPRIFRLNTWGAPSSGIRLCYAKSLQSCPTLCDPIDGSHQAPPSLRFSRQEHWSGLPFPSQMHENENWKWNRSVVSDTQRPHGLQPTRLLHPWDSPGKSTGVGCHCLLRGIRLAWPNLPHMAFSERFMPHWSAVSSSPVVWGEDIRQECEPH